MARETGKAVKDAKAEIVRSQDTLSLSAEEAVRIEGEHIPLDASAMGTGAQIKAASGLRRVALELGGNGVTIVHADAKIAEAAPICGRNAMRLAGQSCISVQTVYVHRSVYDKFVDLVVTEVKKLKLGDPLDPATDVGTLIDERAAQRVESWIKEAAQGGAKVMTGGHRSGAQIEPTVLAGVEPDMKVVCDEVFGPVISLLPYDDIDAVFRIVSESRFGLQTGIFTAPTELVIRAVRSLRTGGVIINGSSTWRTDQLAYGGVKDSGIGCGVPRYSIRDMTEERMALFNY